MCIGNVICLGRKAVVKICLVPESREINDEQIKKEIERTLKCNWLAEVEKVTVTLEQ